MVTIKTQNKYDYPQEPNCLLFAIFSVGLASKDFQILLAQLSLWQLRPPSHFFPLQLVLFSVRAQYYRRRILEWHF